MFLDSSEAYWVLYLTIEPERLVLMKRKALTLIFDDKSETKPNVDAKLSNIRDDLPVLYIGGRHDPVATPQVIKRSRKFVPQLEDLEVDAGHWVLAEPNSREIVTKKVLEWLPKAIKQGGGAKL